jgi:DNA-binding CsgD family transcriptional regulator
MAVFEEFVAATRNLNSIEALAAEFGRALVSEGYQNHILTSVTNQKVGKVAWLDFPDKYAETYVAQNWQAADPVLACSLVARRPFNWEHVQSKPTISNTARKVMDDCQSLGVHSGIVFPIYGKGAECEVVSISKREKTSTDPNRIPLLHAICTQVWCKFLNLTLPDDEFGIIETLLTPRERETLQWTKSGKSNQQISEIMQISERTVQHHITQVMQKLGVSNRVSAVVVAIQRGVIN